MAEHNIQGKGIRGWHSQGWQARKDKKAKMKQQRPGTLRPKAKPPRKNQWQHRGHKRSNGTEVSSCVLSMSNKTLN